MAFFEKKSGMMEQMIGSVKEMAQRTDPITSPELSPEQLWANSMVPMLMRMSQDVRDEFTLHVQQFALKAIRGEWPKYD